MLQKFRDILWAAVVAILLVLLVQQCQKTKSTEDLYGASQEEMKAWVNRYGHAIGEVRIQKMNRDLFEKYHHNIVDSLKREIGTARIKSVVNITRVIRDTVTVAHDSACNIFYTDRWATFSQPTLSTLAYNLNDSLSVVSFKKHYGFLGLKSKYVTQVVNYNPHVKMKGATSFEIAPEPRRVGLGLVVGYGIGSQGLTPFVGGGITYRIW